MHAAVHRYVASEGSKQDLAEAAYRLGLSLADARGFVAAVAIMGNGSLVTIRLFDDQATLLAAGVLADRWAAQNQLTSADSGNHVVIGEVVAQKGL